MFKTFAIKARKELSWLPQVINTIDHRPHWVRVFEALQYEQFIDRETPYHQIKKSNTHPVGLSVKEYKEGVVFLNGHGFIDFPPEEGATFEGITTEGFELVRDRQRTKSQAKQKRATSKLTLALVIASAVTLLNLSDWPLRLALLSLVYIGLTVIYDIIIRNY